MDPTTIMMLAGLLKGVYKMIKPNPVGLDRERLDDQPSNKNPYKEQMSTKLLNMFSGTGNNGIKGMFGTSPSNYGSSAMGAGSSIAGGAGSFL